MIQLIILSLLMAGIITGFCFVVLIHYDIKKLKKQQLKLINNGKTNS